MSSEVARVPGIKGVIETPAGPLRTAAGGPIPDCPKCKSNKHVIRLWHGSRKVWVCDVHYRVASTKKKEATLMQRVLHRIPEADTYSISEILPNRAARRRRK